MSDHRKPPEKGNPFAICRAQGKRLDWSKEKIERCILELKQKMGLKNDEDIVAAFVRFVESYVLPSVNSPPTFGEDFFDASNSDVLEFMAAPFSVYGGKRYLAAKISPLIPPHRRYVEPFAGAAAIMFAKEKSEEEILVDVDKDKLNALGILKSFDDGEIKKLAGMDWQASKSLFTSLKESNPSDRMGRFRRFMYLTWNSFGRRRDSFAFSSPMDVQGYFEKKMPKYRDRLKDVRIFEGDWKKAVEKFDAPSTFFYFDPPYIGTSNKRAEHFKEPSARELADVLKGVKGKFLLSNTDVPEIRDEFSQFTVHSVNVPTRVDQVHADSKKVRKELLIGNFEFAKPATIAATEDTVFVKPCWACDVYHE